MFLLVLIWTLQSWCCWLIIKLQIKPVKQIWYVRLNEIDKIDQVLNFLCNNYEKQDIRRIILFKIKQRKLKLIKSKEIMASNGNVQWDILHENHYNYSTLEMLFGLSAALN